MYLEGIFGVSGEIKALLLKEALNFQSISSKFLTRMKDVAESPMIFKVQWENQAQDTVEKGRLPSYASG
jgi:hypothetical protein